MDTAAFHPLCMCVTGPVAPCACAELFSAAPAQLLQRTRDLENLAFKLQQAEGMQCAASFGPSRTAALALCSEGRRPWNAGKPLDPTGIVLNASVY